MAGEHSSPPDIEILVHATAPSRAADDVTYRRLAQATVAFRPDTIYNIYELQPEQKKKRDEEVHASLENAGQTASSRHEDQSPPPATSSAPQPFIIDSQDLSFEGAWDNRSSPRLRDSRLQQNLPTVDATSTPSEAQSSSWQQPPSQIADSYPLPPQNPLFVSPTRTLQHYIQRTSLQQIIGQGPTLSQQGSQLDRPLGETERIDVPSSLPIPDQESTASQDRHVQIVPVTPAVPAKRKEPPVETHEGDDSIMDLTHISSSDVSLPPPPASLFARAESAPAQVRQQDSATSSSRLLGAQPAHLVRSASDTRNNNNKPSETSFAGTTPLQTLEIWPPSPPVGIADIDAASLITDRLASLSKSLSSRYRPDPDVSRPVEDLERGYWLADCSAWNTAARDEAWLFLASYLGRSLAGWGVWCRRDAAHMSIRMYCWGCVAEHAYLLLYLASGRKLKTTGAVWVDAEGKVALRVPPLEKRD